MSEFLQYSLKNKNNEWVFFFKLTYKTIECVLKKYICKKKEVSEFIKNSLIHWWRCFFNNSLNKKNIEWVFLITHSSIKIDGWVFKKLTHQINDWVIKILTHPFLFMSEFLKNSLNVFFYKWVFQKLTYFFGEWVFKKLNHKKKYWVSFFLNSLIFFLYDWVY